jgi:hypothetical protein
MVGRSRLHRGRSRRLRLNSRKFPWRAARRSALAGPSGSCPGCAERIATATAQPPLTALSRPHPPESGRPQCSAVFVGRRPKRRSRRRADCSPCPSRRLDRSADARRQRAASSTTPATPAVAVRGTWLAKSRSSSRMDQWLGGAEVDEGKQTGTDDCLTDECSR